MSVPFLRRPFALLAVATVGLTAAACDREDVAEAERETQEAVAATADAAGVVASETRRALDELDGELRELEADLQESEAVADVSVDSLRREYREIERRTAAMARETDEALQRSERNVRDDLLELEFEIAHARLRVREEREEFVSHAETLLAELEQDMEVVEGTVDATGEEMEADFREAVQTARADLEEAQRELGAVMDATDAEFEEARVDLAEELAQLRRDLRELELSVDVEG